MAQKRSSGIILHPTSLPGPDGIGDLGPEAYHWIDFLSETGCGLWQILPLGPTGYGDSPYQSFSAFAGNPYLVSPALLFEEKLLNRSDLSDRPNFPDNYVEYGDVINWKITLLDRAYRRFTKLEDSDLHSEFEIFQKREAYWLDDYALFMAIKDAHGGKSWKEWTDDYRKRDSKVLAKFQEENQESIMKTRFRQFLFFRQWQELHNYARSKNIQVIGDIPIFVSFDGSDAWSHPELFFFDADLLPTVVAGVPPDYFSETGQLWGNPLYRWSRHKETGYAWWMQRIQATLRLVDFVRIDHFRGFAAYWEIPYGKPTAVEGRWVPGPGADIFQAIQEKMGSLPIIAEDLGVITPDVVAIRDSFHLPGMKLLQFAFSTDSADPFLPHNYIENCVAYTGTHDNDTSRGWYHSAPEVERDFCRRYLARSGDDISWDMIRFIWSSVAGMTLAPIQDFLSLGTEARMNYPGKASGNWTWRIPARVLDDKGLNYRIHELNNLYSRLKDRDYSIPLQGHI
jgi:4-alpha-glucanotransferase